MQRRAFFAGIAVLGCTLLPVALLSAPSLAHAGQIRETDLIVSSHVGKVLTTATGDKTEARTTVHSVDVRDRSQTGEINVTGRAGGVTTQAGGQNTSASSAIGGVNVGGK